MTKRIEGSRNHKISRETNEKGEVKRGYWGENRIDRVTVIDPVRKKCEEDMAK